MHWFEFNYTLYLFTITVVLFITEIMDLYSVTNITLHSQEQGTSKIVNLLHSVSRLGHLLDLRYWGNALFALTLIVTIILSLSPGIAVQCKGWDNHREHGDPHWLVQVSFSCLWLSSFPSLHWPRCAVRAECDPAYCSNDCREVKTQHFREPPHFFLSMCSQIS